MYTHKTKLSHFLYYHDFILIYIDSSELCVLDHCDRQIKPCMHLGGGDGGGRNR